MKNLKKVVALSLAAVMMFGMMVVGAGAAEPTYKDTADSDYGVAIEVASALKFISGSNGTFNPEGELVRADAAILAARVALGPDMATKLTGATTAFSDVPANAYYANYVAWAVKEGYIKGNDGKFDPMGKLQGVAFAKLLLNVLGYKDKYQEYSGSWENIVFNVTYDAALAGLLNGLENVDLEKTMTREQAAQMAFNALNARRVRYDEGQDITIGDVTISSKTELEYVDGENTSFGEKVYKLTQKTYVAAGKDVIPSTIWAVDGKNIDGTVESVAPAMKLTSATKLKTLTDAGYTVTATVNSDIEKLSGNGVTLQLYINDKKEIYTVIESYEQLDTVTNVKTDRDGNVTAITLATAGTFNAATEKTPADPGFDTLLAMDLEAKDLVLINVTSAAKDAKDTLSYTVIGEYETVGGVASKKNAQAITLDGTELAYAHNAQTGFGTVTLGKANYAILDTNGFVLLANEVDPEEAPAPNYMIVTDTWSVATGNTKEGTTYHFSGVTMAGEKVEGQYVASMIDTDKADDSYKFVSQLSTVTVKNDTDKDKVELVYDGVKAHTKGQELMVQYSVDKDGIYTLSNQNLETAVPTTVNGDILATDVELNDDFFASDVQFVYLYNNKGKVAPSTKTGVQVIDAKDKDGKDTTNPNYYVFTTKDALNNDIITRVFVLGAPAYVPAPVEYVDGIYYLSNVSTDFNYYTVVEDGDKLVTLGNVTAYVDGEKTDLDFVVKTVSAGKYALDKAITAGFYKVEFDKLGAAKVTAVETALVDATGKAVVDVFDSTVDLNGNVKYANGEYYIVVDGVYYNASNALVLDLTKDGGHATVNDLLNSSNAAEVSSLKATVLRNSTKDDNSIIQIVVTDYSEAKG